MKSNTILKTNIHIKDVKVAEKSKIIYNSEKNSLVVDFGSKLNGFAVFEFDIPNGLNSNNSTIEKNVALNYGPREDFIIFNGRMIVYPGKGNIIFASEHFYSFQYLEFEIPSWLGTKDVDWELKDVIVQTQMNTSEVIGVFNTDNDLINKIWEAGKTTVEACVFPHRYAYSSRCVMSAEQLEFVESWTGYKSDYVLVDGPRRDREVWVGDLLPEIRTYWYAFGEREVIRNSLKLITDQQREDGFLPASSVSYQNFSEYCCWFSVVLHEYILFSGDFEFYYDIQKQFRKLMDYIISILDEKGMLNLTKMQTWAWTLSRDGNVTSSQCVLYKALVCAGELESWTGNQEKSDRFLNRAENLKKMIQKLGWDEQAGAYKDTCSDNQDVRYSIDANCYAIIFGIATKEQSEKALNFLQSNMHTPFGTRVLYPAEAPDGRNWAHNDHIWPFVVSFEVEALFKTKRIKEAYELLESCWGNMISKGSHTFWEIVDGKTGDFMKDRIHNPGEGIDTWNSYCHGWSGGVSQLLQAFSAGIRPLKPGFQEFEIDPKPGKLKNIKTVVPLSDDRISFEMYKTKEYYIAKLTVPENTKGVWTGNSLKPICVQSKKEIKIFESGTHEFEIHEVNKNV